MLRILDDLFRRALLYDDAVGHEDDAVGNVSSEFDFMSRPHVLVESSITKTFVDKL